MSDAPTPPLSSTLDKLLARLVPDGRGWIALGVFLLTSAILGMIRENPALLANASFMQLVGSIAGAGGLGLVLAFHFASSSGTAKANARADKADQRAEAAADGANSEGKSI